MSSLAMATAESDKMQWSELSNVLSISHPDNDAQLGPIIQKDNGDVVILATQLGRLSGIITYQPKHNKSILTDVNYEISELTAQRRTRRPNAFAFHEQSNTLYFTRRTGIVYIDIDTGIINHIHITTAKQCGFYYPTTLFFIDDKLHIFGLWDDLRHGSKNIHTVYDIKTGDLKSETISLISDSVLCQHSMIYVPSRNIFIFSGGEMSEDIVSYNIMTNESKSIKNVSEVRDIAPSMILTKDGKYVIIFYKIQEWDSDLVEAKPIQSKILIIDVEKDKVTESAIELPKSGEYDEYNAFLVCDVNKSDIIINGYLRQFWTRNESVNLRGFPSELKTIIFKYHFQQNVHLLNGKGDHYNIPLSVILAK